ncbi:hypothetical protein ATI61_11636 [Archangium gephyra]|uniref:Uncharacterized protein n=1 Tax=Archangium gephyra TaxID=48 RepID=A0AAC8QB37_9BACT|nr:hypothetical protein [Archangium gephyra]AKJ03786.1 Hypothetical protein AA314_05412 [Archangium gephyra]REG23568.1 hypothetical protein ATI61_11636 [Archangium gephyra]
MSSSTRIGGDRPSSVSTRRPTEVQQQNTVRSEPPPPRQAPRTPAIQDSFTPAPTRQPLVAEPTPAPEQAAQNLLADPAFTRLNAETQTTALEVVGALGNRRIAQNNLRNLTTSDAFAQLNPTPQRAMLAAQARAPEDRQLTRQLQELAADPAFRGLDESVQTTTLTQLGNHTADDRARRTLTELATSPGFAGLPTGDQNRLMNYVGGTNANLSTPARRDLGALMNSNGFRNATADQQQAQLSGFLQGQPSLPEVVSAISGPGTIPQQPFTVHGPTAVQDHPFTAGAANANRYEVEIAGQRIPVYVPEQLNAANGNFHSIEQVAQGLASLPANSRAIVNQVNVEPAQNPSDAYWAERYGDPDFRSYMTAGAEGIVSVYPTLEPVGQDALDGSLIHETGHTRSMQAWGSDYTSNQWAGWRTAIENDGLEASQYATHTPGEDFAESLVLYERVRGTPQEAEFRAMMPERFRILDEMLGGTQ